jgi:hypothetical protein
MNNIETHSDLMNHLDNIKMNLFVKKIDDKTILVKTNQECSQVEGIKILFLPVSTKFVDKVCNSLKKCI